MEEDFRSLLLANTALVALVSTRIAWNHIPQTQADPNVSLYLIDSATGLHLQGTDGLTRSRVQVDVRALSVTSAWAVKRAITDQLHGYRGTIGSTVFQSITLLSERQSSEKPGEQLYHRVSLDLEVWSRAA